MGALQPALTESEELFALHGDNPCHGWQIESRLGVTLLRSGDPASALPVLENATRKAPNKPGNHRNLGAALVALGRRGRALAEYAQAVELAPLNFEFRLEYGQLLLDFHDHHRSWEHLLEAEKLCGGCPEIQEPLARLYLATGDFELAVPVLRQIHGQRPTVGTRRSLIQALQGAGNDSLLLDFLDRGSLLNLPADEVMLLVELEGRLNRPTHCKSFALAAGEPEKEAQLVPDSLGQRAGFWGKVSYNLLLAELNGPALAALDRAITLDPDNAIYRNNRVVLLTRLGRHEEAAREWKKVLDLDPTLKERDK